MSSKNLKFFGLIIPGMIVLSQIISAQSESRFDSKVSQKYPVISRLHTLSIHVGDTCIHDSVFHFLVDKLKLPVYYYPVCLGERKYGGIYAGNLILEPCGPYSGYSYVPRNIKAIFFGLTFEPFRSVSHAAMELTNRKINHEVASDEFIYLRDTLLCNENITFSIMDRHDKLADRIKMDSLRNNMLADINNPLGIELIKEIWIGYKDSTNLMKWMEFISPSELTKNKIWKENNLPEFHFTESKINEVQAIVFKVKSFEKAKQYLSDNNLTGKIDNRIIEFDKSKAFGLSIYFTEKD